MEQMTEEDAKLLSRITTSIACLFTLGLYLPCAEGLTNGICTFFFTPFIIAATIMVGELLDRFTWRNLIVAASHRVAVFGTLVCLMIATMLYCKEHYHTKYFPVLSEIIGLIAFVLVGFCLMIVSSFAFILIEDYYEGERETPIKKDKANVSSLDQEIQNIMDETLASMDNNAKVVANTKANEISASKNMYLNKLALMNETQLQVELQDVIGDENYDKAELVRSELDKRFN